MTREELITFVRTEAEDKRKKAKDAMTLEYREKCLLKAEAWDETAIKLLEGKDESNPT